ncbi:MAG: PEGA domain-containing protein [Gallionellaceae bacterium]|nr:PEGA domain-containing protein [Gallionellaceae bacterium]
MKQFLQRIFMGFIAVLSVGCSNASMPKMPCIAGMFGCESSEGLSVNESKKANPNAPLLKYAASIHISRYTDTRKMGNPRKLGTGAQHVSGMSGNDIVTEQDVATLVTNSMKKRLDDAGFPISEAQNSDALFELSGVVKELTLNVKDRDEISILIETTLKDMSTGKVVWSGIVAEKNDRFAGVSGNNKEDIALYLRKELGIVTEKTTEAISASLMAARPELFNLTPGTKPIPGVTVLVAPAASKPAPAATIQAAPVPGSNAAVPAPSYTPHATDTSGLLLVNTNPPRAKVYLDGVYFGMSPLHLEMEPGVHAISVKLEGYKMVTEKVSVRKGDNTEIELNLER